MEKKSCSHSPCKITIFFPFFWKDWQNCHRVATSNTESVFHRQTRNTFLSCDHKQQEVQGCGFLFLLSLSINGGRSDLSAVLHKRRRQRSAPGTSTAASHVGGASRTRGGDKSSTSCQRCAALSKRRRARKMLAAPPPHHARQTRMPSL